MLLLLAYFILISNYTCRKREHFIIEIEDSLESGEDFSNKEAMLKRDDSFDLHSSNGLMNNKDQKNLTESGRKEVNGLKELIMKTIKNQHKKLRKNSTKSRKKLSKKHKKKDKKSKDYPSLSFSFQSSSGEKAYNDYNDSYELTKKDKKKERNISRDKKKKTKLKKKSKGKKEKKRKTSKGKSKGGKGTAEKVNRKKARGKKEKNEFFSEYSDLHSEYI